MKQKQSGNADLLFLALWCIFYPILLVIMKDPKLAVLKSGRRRPPTRLFKTIRLPKFIAGYITS